MKRLLTATAVIEVCAGLALIAIPSPAATLLIGPLTTPAADLVARVGGAGLLALGVACGLARGDSQGGAARALVAGALVYNVGAIVILGKAGLGSDPVGIALWPAVVLHVAMAGWCVLDLVRTPKRER